MLKKLLLFFFIASSLFSTNLKDRLLKGEKGDFIVTLQNHIYSLLLIQDINKSCITIAEISLPENNKSLPWRTWVLEGAPGNTAWNIYEIDLEKNRLSKCYSVSRSCFLSGFDQDNFLAKLLTLPLNPLNETKRKKIGPAPLNEDEDHRAIWNPPIIVDGKAKKTSFTVYQTLWPRDGSDLSGKILDLYFDKEGSFPFPFWIQVTTGSLDVMLKIIDSGKNLISLKSLPKN